MAYAIEAVNAGRAFSTHLFDWSRHVDATVIGAAADVRGGGIGVVGGIERLFFTTHEDGTAPASIRRPTWAATLAGSGTWRDRAATRATSSASPSASASRPSRRCSA